MEFEFATATRIVFGAGRVREFAPAAKSLGPRGLIVTGRSADRGEHLAALLKECQVSSVSFHLKGEPTVQEVRDGALFAKKERCEFVAGIGGGAALDGAKAIAALMTNPSDVLEYLEVVGRAQPLLLPPAPSILVPTTAGTGAEVTRNAVLASPEHRFKVSLRSPLMLPKMALIDPELTCGLPPHLTAFTGLDALTQLIEPFVSHRANPLTDGFCVEGLKCVARSLRRAHAIPQDVQARSDMSLASLCSGLALANAALGAVHGFAAPLGGMYSAPHGALCAAVLPHAMHVNIRALKERDPDGAALRRYDSIAQILSGSPQATAEDGAKWVSELCQELRIPPLSSLGVAREDFAELVQKAGLASSMKGNPITLNREELLEILERSFDRSPALQ